MFSFYHPHKIFSHVREITCWIVFSLLLIGCSGGSSRPPSVSVAIAGTSGAEATVGERLFVETRFAQAFKVYLDSGGKVNNVPTIGDPVMDLSETTRSGVGLPGPFAGHTMNCRACHLVDEHVGTPGGGMRTYADFAQRSPVPNRSDGKRTAPRNSPPLVNASLDRLGGGLFHFDGEFSTMEELTAGTFTGRNLGWLPGQKAKRSHTSRGLCEATMEMGSLHSNSTDFPIECCSPGPIQPFRMNFAFLWRFEPILSPGPIRKFLMRRSRSSLPM